MAGMRKSIHDSGCENVRTPAASGGSDVSPPPARGHRVPSALASDPALMTPGVRLAAFGRSFASAFQKRADRLTASSHSARTVPNRNTPDFYTPPLPCSAATRRWRRQGGEGKEMF